MRLRWRLHSLRRRGLAAAVAALLLAVHPVSAAVAGSPYDRGFGHRGVATIPADDLPKRVGTVAIDDLAQASRGKFVAALGDLSGHTYFGAARFRSGGALDRGFGGGGTVDVRSIGGVKAQAEAVAVEPDGDVLLAGFRTNDPNQESSLDQYSAVLARFRPDGRLDRSFGHRGFFTPKSHTRPGGDRFHDVAVGPDGRILAVGDRKVLTQHGYRTTGFAVALRPDGRVDRSFGTHGKVVFRSRVARRAYTGLRSSLILPSGKVLLAGYRENHFTVIRLLADGALDRSFGDGGELFIGPPDPDLCCDEYPYALLSPAPNGKVLATSIGTDATFSIARLDQGGLDPSFGGGRGWISQLRVGRRWDAEPFAVSAQGDGRIVVSGMVSGYVPKTERLWSRLSAIRLRADGLGLDRSFGHHGVFTLRNPGYEAGANASFTDSRGRVVLGGAYLSGSEKRFQRHLLLVRLR